MNNTPSLPLPPGLTVLERGWLSANNVLALGDEGATLVDSGYSSHAEQTLALVENALGGQALTQLINTHLHSDHCGGNAALQARYPGLCTAIPPGHAEAVRQWDESVLSFRPTGQHCPRFVVHEVLHAGQTRRLANLDWQVHAAPGHDPHAVLLFQPDHGILISGDALWENGFGVVFPELEGESGFDEVGATLDLIEQLQPRIVIPGHGPLILGSVAVQAALQRARSRLQQFVSSPWHHTLYGAKVLIKFKLMEQRQWPLHDLHAWAQSTPLLRKLHTQAQERGPAHGADVPAHMADWVTQLLHALERSGAAQLTAHAVLDAGSAS